MNKFMKALKDFESLCKLYPKDEDAKDKLKKARAMAMQAAIHKEGGQEEIISMDPDD